MTTYTLSSRTGFIVFAALPFGIAAGFVVVLLLPSLRDGRWLTVFFTMPFIFVFSAAGIGILRQVYEIRIAADGHIDLVRVVGAVHLTAGQVRVLEGKLWRDYDGNLSVWRLQLRSTRGDFGLGEFPNVMEFAHRVQAHNPNVQMRGLWPMGPPWRGEAGS
jgi:hypothetical protein